MKTHAMGLFMKIQPTPAPLPNRMALLHNSHMYPTARLAHLRMKFSPLELILWFECDLVILTLNEISFSTHYEFWRAIRDLPRFS